MRGEDPTPAGRSQNRIVSRTLVDRFPTTAIVAQTLVSDWLVEIEVIAAD